MGNSKSDKELEKAYKDLKDYNSSKKDSNPASDLLQFFIGLVLLGAGLYMIFQNVYVESNFGGGYIFHIGGWGLPNGTVFIPLLIGIVMLFLMDKKIYGWVVLSIGVVIILAAIIMSVHMHWRRTDAFMFVLMFGMVAAGAGLVLRQLFKKN